MIDYFFKFTSEAAAIADAAGTVYYVAGAGWNADRVTPGIKVWRPSQDTIDGNGNVVHTYLTGWFGVISRPSQITALLNDANLQVAIDRDAANAGLPCIIKNNLTLALLNDLQFQPVFMGANYPWGQFS